MKKFINAFSFVLPVLMVATVSFAGPVPAFATEIPSVHINEEETVVIENPHQDEDAGTAKIFVNKVVCESEADLPNWGDGKDDSNADVSITTTTAFEYVAHSDGKCQLMHWTFEWAPSTTPNPLDNTGVAGAPWTAFTSQATVPAGTTIWVREQMKDGYVEFSGNTAPAADNQPGAVSAELYCGDDVLNYDNYDYLTTVKNHEYNCVAFNAPKAKACDATDVSNVIVSDTTTLEGADASVLVSPVNASWVSSIGSSIAAWIWGENPLSQSTTDKTEVFTKTFNIIGTPKDSTLELAADNTFSVSVNGNTVGSDATEFNYGATKTFTIPAAYLINGSNTVVFTVKNMGVADSTPTSNPAGLIYKLTVNENDCVIPPPQVCPVNTTGVYPNCTPIVVVVDVCSNLPGNQSSTPEGYTQNGEQCFSQNQCSDGINNNDGDSLVDATDPACHTDGNASNPESYDPTDTTETTQCSDGVNNDDGDSLIDANDPGCQSGTEGAWNPNDNDESNTVVPPTPTSTRRSGSSGSRPSSLGKVLGAESSCGIYVDKFLRKGYKNNTDAVKKVQKFLNDYSKAGITESGIFDDKTEAALKAFQSSHKDKILTPWNIKTPTGIFYLTTQTEVNNIMCPTLGLPIPTNLVNFTPAVIN